MGHSVGKAAENAVRKSESVKRAERTPIQIIDEVRKNLAAGLAVTPDDQRFLLSAYNATQIVLTDADKKIVELQALVMSHATTITELQTKLEEFRSVYESENRSQSLHIERVPLMQTPEAVEVAETVSGFEHTVGFARMSGAGSGE